MERIIKYIENNFEILVVFILIINLFLKCSSDKKITKLNEKIDKLEIRQEKVIQLEGLKSEKRMIQSTDRKILDVQRQSELDKEISNLESQIKK